MPRLDEFFKLTISSDKMTATIVKVEELPEEFDVTYEELVQFCKDHGVIYGLNENVLNELTYENKAVIAKGKPPVHGKDAYLEVVAKRDDDDKKEIDDNIPVNFKDVLRIPTVRCGDVVGRKVAATKGTKGMNVLGEEVEPIPGRDITLYPGQNTKLDEKGETLYALVDGQLSVHKSTIHVLPTYEVHDDISLKTGNIDFVGNVIIHGSVPPGFEVKAGGDIHVRGTVEAATLKAGGSIIIVAGIVGQNKSYIEAGKDLKTTFINQGDVHVGGNIEVVQAILHSKCSARGKVVCTEGKGLIVGGSTSALFGIEANEFGNSLQTATELYIGELEEDVKRRAEHEKRYNQAKDDVQKLGKLLKMLIEKEKKKTMTIKELEIKRKAQRSLYEAKRTMDEAAALLEELRPQTPRERGYIKAHRTIYPNVSVQFGKYRRKLTSTYQNAFISLIDGEIVVQTS